MKIDEEIELALDILAKRMTQNYVSEEKTRRRIYEDFASWLVAKFESEGLNK